MTSPANMSQEEVRRTLAGLTPEEQAAFASYIEALRVDRDAEREVRHLNGQLLKAEEGQRKARTALAEACTRVDKVLTGTWRAPP